MPEQTTPQLRIRDNAAEAAADCAAYVFESLAETLRAADRASIAISGGSTPKLLFADFAKANFDWSKVHVFWVDERCVPPDDSESNFKLASDNWFATGDVPPANIHRILGELTPEEGAQRYLADIQQFFGLREGEIPAFDVLHRGMGPDAHTASLFPGDPLIQNTTGIAAHVWVEKFKMHRVTLLPAVLRAAKRTVLQVAGEEKADALRAVLFDDEDPLKYPCQIASRDARAIWFLDKAAAAKL